MRIKGLLFIIVTFFFQLTLLGSNGTTAFPFLDGVPISTSNDYFLILYWYLPIMAMAFFITGYFRVALHSHGMLNLTRNYSRFKWILTRFLNVMFVLFLFVSAQILFFYTNSVMFQPYYQIFNKMFILLTVMYYLSLLITFSFQLLLELFIEPQLAQLTTNIYIIFSIILAKQLYIIGAPNFISYLLIPNYGNGFRNGLSYVAVHQGVIIHYTVGFFILITLQICIIGVSVLKFKKMDIL
ncbi:DUF2705 family protein [Bacillus velezensis]|uniref:DUF2705 family protein n=1 Tax=Bacillus velezensis TaxID=492670 RepID=UPI003CF6C00E